MFVLSSWAAAVALRVYPVSCGPQQSGMNWYKEVSRSFQSTRVCGAAGGFSVSIPDNRSMISNGGVWAQGKSNIAVVLNF